MKFALIRWLSMRRVSSKLKNNLLDVPYCVRLRLLKGLVNEIDRTVHSCKGVIGRLKWKFPNMSWSGKGGAVWFEVVVAVRLPNLPSVAVVSDFSTGYDHICVWINVEFLRVLRRWHGVERPKYWGPPIGHPLSIWACIFCLFTNVGSIKIAELVQNAPL